MNYSLKVPVSELTSLSSVCAPNISNQVVSAEQNTATVNQLKNDGYVESLKAQSETSFINDHTGLQNTPTCSSPYTFPNYRLENQRTVPQNNELTNMLNNLLLNNNNDMQQIFSRPPAPNQTCHNSSSIQNYEAMDNKAEILPNKVLVDFINDRVRQSINNQLNKIFSSHDLNTMKDIRDYYVSPNEHGQKKLFTETKIENDQSKKINFWSKTTTASENEQTLINFTKELNSAFKPVNNLDGNKKYNINKLIFKHDKSTLKPSSVMGDKKSLELQSLRKRSLEEVDLPNFLSNDEISMDEKESSIYCPTEEKNRKQRKDVSLDQLKDFSKDANGRNYDIFDMKSRHLFIVIKKIFTEQIITECEVEKLNQIDKTILVGIINRKYKLNFE